MIIFYLVAAVMNALAVIYVITPFMRGVGKTGFSKRGWAIAFLVPLLTVVLCAMSGFVDLPDGRFLAGY
jgi:hypothetical protein